MSRRRSLMLLLSFALIGLTTLVPRTFAAETTYHALAEHPVLEKGSSDPAVGELQSLLNRWIGAHPDRGLEQLPITGYFGDLTEQAVIVFQQAHGLPAQGYVGALTWNALLDEQGGGTPAQPNVTSQCSQGSGRGLVIPRGVLSCRPWMVMIDNYPDAYPQSGLDKAAIVFEGLAEYGITRYIATYADGWTPDASQIGPMRSTRAYFAQWAMAFHPVYAHAGGSPDGLELVQSTNQLVNFEGLAETNYDYRDQNRLAPHNLYTSSQLLRQYARDRRVTAFSDPGVGYLYTDPAPLARASVSSLSYYFLDEGSRGSFAYDASTNAYYRYIFGHAHIDRQTGNQLRTSNVVVMAVDGAKRLGDAKARIDQYVIGNGPARVFKNGGMVNATWVKNSGSGPLRFYSDDGSEIVFSSGQVWIAAIPSLERLTVR
ncbi:MAG: hypothetical protein NVS4B8_19650 [Herpetosiphon sp.]